MGNFGIDKKLNYINLRIGTENFAINVDKVLEIIQLEKLTCIPNSPDFILGILNFRGSIVPIIDMHKRFRIITDDNYGKMIVVVDITHKNENILMGLLVDQVTNVVEFEFKSIRSVPDLGIKYNPEFIEGFVEYNGKFIMVMNIDRVLSVDELSEISLVSSQ
jgi:purine-binding chemotaxis protein CheW